MAIQWMEANSQPILRDCRSRKPVLAGSTVTCHTKKFSSGLYQRDYYIPTCQSSPILAGTRVLISMQEKVAQSTPLVSLSQINWAESGFHIQSNHRVCTNTNKHQLWPLTSSKHLWTIYSNRCSWDMDHFVVYRFVESGQPFRFKLVNAQALPVL